jgi:hypothetical protein
MLLLFTLSIMPKLYLHDVFAAHHDKIGNAGHSQPGIIKDGYSCDVNDLVATSPFTGTEKIAAFNPEIDFPVLHTRYTSQIATAAPECFTLRGPPVLA